MNRTRPTAPLTLDRLMAAYGERRSTIRLRLNEFAEVGRAADESLYLEELAFCIFAAGTSARHGLQCVERVRPYLLTGDREELREALRGQRFYNVRSGFLHQTREYLRSICDLRIGERLRSLPDSDERRDFLALNPRIAGIGMKEASHYLRNVGFRGYAILDKHILRGLHDLGVVESPDRPGRPERYREIEHLLRDFAHRIEIDPDELDLLLWSERTGEILK